MRTSDCPACLFIAHKEEVCDLQPHFHAYIDSTVIGGNIRSLEDLAQWDLAHAEQLLPAGLHTFLP